jgi:hypothetical protein
LAVIFAWLNKRDWKYPGPIATMAVQNEHALANPGHETHLFVGAGEVASNIEDDLREFYRLEPVEKLQVLSRARARGIVLAKSRRRDRSFCAGDY